VAYTLPLPWEIDDQTLDAWIAKAQQGPPPGFKAGSFRPYLIKG
jgi:hypothetical protein